MTTTHFQSNIRKGHQRTHVLMAAYLTLSLLVSSGFGALTWLLLAKLKVSGFRGTPIEWLPRFLAEAVNARTTEASRALGTLGLCIGIAFLVLLLAYWFFYVVSTNTRLSQAQEAGKLDLSGTPLAAMSKDFGINLGGLLPAAQPADDSAPSKSQLMWVRLLGGRVISHTDATLEETRVLNALEEIAVAATMPVPELFVLDDEPRINAVAVGVDAQHCAIGVTAGAVAKLSRNEMQALLAQQLGHLLEQDPQLNLRLAAMTASLRLFATLGEMAFILAAPLSLLKRERLAQLQARRRGEDNDKPSAGFSRSWVIGQIAFAMWMLGWFGAKAGQLLQSRVNREKEFLSDAHAIRLTRNPESLKAAFEKILHDLDVHTEAQESSEKKRPYAGSAFSANIAHAFFVSTYAKTSQQQLKGGWLDTHPPLAKRIERLT